MMIRMLLLCVLSLPAWGQWSRLAPLPDKEGFAGSFAGVSSGCLIVAGGTHFPDKMPWEGGSKVWYDDVFLLREPGGTWSRAGKLPRPNGYGVSLTTPEGMLLIGGGDAREHFQAVWRLRLEGAAVRFESLPRLPRPCAFMAGAIAGEKVYVGGGIEHPADTTALKSFWVLDLAHLDRGWLELPVFPGPARILAAMGAADGSVFVFSGASLKPGADGKPEREWLKDGWRYTPSQGWRPVSGLAAAAVAAPGPLPFREGKLHLLGGDDGALLTFEPKDQHPGFPRRMLAYDPTLDLWEQAGELPFSRVTTPAVEWRGRVIIPGGEARPGKRSPEVWQGMGSHD